MSNRDSNKQSGLSDVSRRDFVLGRMLRWQRTNTPEGGRADKAEQSNGVGVPSMRYPRSLDDVAAVDAVKTGERLSNAAARRRSIPLFRPPGAIDEASFLAGCTKCELCMVACPYNAIIHAPAQLREAAGTPMIVADRQPCLMCADFPCIAACEPNVLSELMPIRIGTARITEHLCLPYHGKSCTVCVDVCPVDNAIRTPKGLPTVDEGICTGCGVCRKECPAPENAVLLMPMFIRSSAHTKADHGNES